MSWGHRRPPGSGGHADASFGAGAPASGGRPIASASTPTLREDEGVGGGE